MTDHLCAAEGCGHPKFMHIQQVGAHYCRACFDRYPSDDSTVEGGVYHAFVQ